MKRVAILPGDGIGPEIMQEAIKVLDAVQKKFNFRLTYEFADVGGAAIYKHGHALPPETLDLCQNCDAILFGRVTSYKPYPSTQIGLFLRLIDLQDGQLVWAVDDVWDTTDRMVVRRIQNYFFNEMRESYDPVGDELGIMGTNAFQKFVSSEIAQTLDPQSKNQSRAKAFFESPVGTDLRRFGRGQNEFWKNVKEDL